MPAKGFTFVMAGGGTGGHVVPSIAVARELQARGHEVFFIGTRQGLEAKLVPAAGFPIEWIEIGGLMRLSWTRKLRTLAQLPGAIWRCRHWMRTRHVRAVFSMGGYAAAPVAAAARLQNVPVILMEPNAVPGVTNRRTGRFARRILLTFAESASYFPANRISFTGLPVRAEFFAVPPRPPHSPLSLLITGGSQGSRTLNEAVEQAWPQLAARGIRVVHQTGAAHYEALRERFAASGVAGELMPFLDDMPRAFADADVILCRSGAGTVSELAAAGKPSILVPFPFAAGDHQRANAQALERLGAALLINDRDLNGARLIAALDELTPERLNAMSAAARQFAQPHAAAAAADLLEQEARA
jgi:UDP-N-acetylglucosamine--N-acetylmuramyl-(pentapeptide) pyrophosphoryl-undecaprenol N-acetylglucosamine transferase